jgi:hypothetical protein
MFNMPEVPADQPAQNVAEVPPNQNNDQPVVAPDIIQMGNVVAPEPAIKKRHIEENSNRTAGLSNMAKVVQPTKENISFETAKAFKLQAEDPNCTLKWDQVIMKDGRVEIALMLCNPLYANLYPQNERETWSADSNLDLMQIANIIYKIYSPPQSAGKNQLQLEKLLSVTIWTMNNWKLRTSSPTRKTSTLTIWERKLRSNKIMSLRKSFTRKSQLTVL